MIDILSKITKLREERHWSEYQLAERSGLTQSTISTWYRKNMIPTIPSLSKVCDAFGITLSQFFLEEDMQKTLLLSETQLQLIEQSAKLETSQREALLHFLKTL